MEKVKCYPNFLLFLSLIFMLSSPAHAQIQIWANDGGDKVTRDELRAHQNSGNVVNSVWNGQKIHIFGAKNEVVSFNLILEAPTTSANNINVLFNTLTGTNSTTISSISAGGDGVFSWGNRNIELFFIEYLEIKGLSTDIFYENWYDERHVPERFRRPWTGEGDASGTWEDRPDHNKFYPDIAVPLELASPFNITAGQNQSIWVDIFIPKTSSAGLYQGFITIQADGNVSERIPVELIVRNVSLPDLPSARTMLYYSQENINSRYLGNSYIEQGTEEYAQALAIADRHFQLAHRHKISLIGEHTRIGQMDEAWTARLSGELFSSARGYDGAGIGVGNNVYSIGTYGSWNWYDNWNENSRADMWTNTDAWVNWFDARAFTTPTDYFLYLIDESTDYAQTEQWAQWIDNNPGPGSRMMSMATGMDLPTALSLTPSLDIPTTWVNFGDTDPWQNAADSITADATKNFYLYNGGRPGSGTFAIEDDGVALWALAWTHYKKKCDRWFYWESTYYDNYQCGMGQTDVFNKAHTYGCFDRVDDIVGETGYNYLNGDGVLFYPGTDLHFPNNNHGVSGPFASLRLKHWRRGLQDVDYLTLAATVDATRTAQIVDNVIPKVAWEVGVTNPEDPTYVYSDISWSTDPDAWERVRMDLADIITGCCLIDYDFSIKVACAEYGGRKYTFSMNYYPNPDDPSGLYWELDLDTIEEIQANGSACISMTDNLNLTIGCVEYLGGRYGLTFDYQNGLYWKFNPLTVKYTP